MTMKKQLHRLAAVAALLLAAGASHATTPVTNPGFESGLSGWTLSGSVTTDALDLHSGSLAARLADDASALTATLSQSVDVASVGSFGFWGRSDFGVLSLVVLTYSDGSDSGTDVSIFDLGNAGWTYYDLTSSLAAGKSLAGFTIYGSSAAATLVDDVVLTSVAAVPEPATPLLMLAGGLLLAGVARRQRRA